MNECLRYITLVFSLSGLSACQNNDESWIPPSVINIGCENYQSISIDQGTLYNNVWNHKAAGSFQWQQCLVQKPDSDPPVYGWSWYWQDKGRDIFSYPQIKRGTSPWEPLPKTNDGLPIQLKSLDSFIVSHELEIEAEAEFNVATSMWMTKTADIGNEANPSVITAEIMVWTYTTEKHLNPAGEKIGIITVDGKGWSVWVDETWGDASRQNDNKWVYVTFKAEAESLSNKFDAVKLLRHPILTELKLDDNYIADVELGTEIMRGRGVVWINDFNLEIQ